LIPWSVFYKFAFVDWVVLEDVTLVLLVVFVWKLYKLIMRIEDRLKEMDDSLDHMEREMARYEDKERQTSPFSPLGSTRRPTDL